MYRPRMRQLMIAALVVAGCKGSEPKPELDTTQPPRAEPPKGPHVTPIVTKSITFVAPDAPWWGELSFACYAAAIDLQPGSKPSEAFTKISPNVEPAMAAADIDLDHDVAAFGLWGCGDGPCLYTALTLRHPDRLGDMLAKLIPGSQPKRVGDEFVVDAPGPSGSRTLHVRALPIAWPAKLPADAWARDAARATHVVFVTGIFGKPTDGDPLAVVGDATGAAARVRDAEGVLADASSRCVIGRVGKRAFQPGFDLDHARFGLAAPTGKSDALGRLLGSDRSLDLEIELVLSPAPTPKAVDQWIADARRFAAGIVDPIRQQFAGQGAMVGVLFDLGSVLANHGFRHEIKDKALLLSWRTDRIPESDLTTYEARLQAIIGSAPP